MKVRYSNAKIWRKGRIETEELWCAEGVITPSGPSADVVIDLKGHLVVPGYIDLQINGLQEDDFTSDPESVYRVAARLPRYGVTAFLPTLVSSTPAHYRNALPKIQCRQGGGQGAAILGIHLEGPFLNPLFCGAHSAANFRSFETPDPLMECYGSLANVKMVTLAPELPKALFWIRHLASKGVVVSAGHTHCTADEFLAGCEAGAAMATHLFNAMTPFHHRAPGPVGVILSSAGKAFSIIADGIHVDPLAVKMAWKANPQGLILVSDGTAHTRLGEIPVERGDQRHYLQGTTILAGSALTLDKAVRNFKRMTGCTLGDAIEAASSKPATILGLGNSKGQLKEGFDADFLLLNDALEVQATFIAGQQVSVKTS